MRFAGGHIRLPERASRLLSCRRSRPRRPRIAGALRIPTSRKTGHRKDCRSKDCWNAEPRVRNHAAANNAQAEQALSVDPVADLIARVEKEYQSGQENYRAGHLEAAKQNFDSAFNQLLGSGFDLQSDDRLEAELNRILDGTNELELAALQQGDGFSEQPSEPALRSTKPTKLPRLSIRM